MVQVQVVKTASVCDLEMCSVDSNDYFDLPTTYMQDEIPVKKENIPTHEDLKQWPYLKEVKLNPINSDIGLLIGSNVPMALEPWKVINSRQNGPYAIKTALGWTVNGPFRKTSVSKNGKRVVMAHRISVVKLENLIRQQIKQDFPEREKEERLEMSQEDKLFMESVSASIKMVDGHYSIALPLKKKDTQFPNNRCVAETVDSVNEERIKKLEEQVYQLIKLTPADKTTSSSSAVVTQQIFKRDTDHTSESECDSGKENRRQSRIPRHRNSLTKKGPAKEIRSRKSDSDPQCRIETSSEATVRTRKKVNIARGAKAVEPVRKFLQRAIGASVDVTSKPKDEAETYRTILEERDQERERRWKAEQAVRKLTDELKCWQTKAGEEKDLQSLALHTTDRLKELLLRERSGRCELKNRVEELEARCRSLTQQVEQARTSEEQHKAALHRLEENISQGESLRAQQQAEEEKRQRELGNKAAVLRRELDIQRAAVRQQKDKLQKLHELLVSREQEHRKQLDLRLQPDGSDFRQAVAKEVAFMEQKHGQRESELQEKLAEGKKQYAALEDEFRMALTIEAARFSEVKDVCDQMTKELVGHKAAFTQFQEKEKKSSSLVQQLTAMVKEQNSRISQLNKAKNDTVTDLKSRFRSLEEELQQDRRASLQLELLKKEKAQLMSQLTAHESVIDGLRAERKIWGQELAHQGVSLAQDRGRLEARIEVLGAELESRKKQSERDGDALKIKAKIVDDQTESIRKLKEALQERDDQLRRMREEATQAQKRFQQQREVARAQQAEAREQLEHLSLRKEELKQQLVDKDVELEEAKRVHGETIKKWQEKTDFLTQLESQVKRMKEKFEAKELVLLEERNKATDAQRAAVAKLHNTGRLLQQKEVASSSVHGRCSSKKMDKRISARTATKTKMDKEDTKLQKRRHRFNCGRNGTKRIMAYGPSDSTRA
ncbi:leucine-rich repeat and coiled-coil domain-containing protein 1-like [Nelusetta ayraudi]|uniref:leucine-rich repeat and coiled-coil domain-containing protein 1-like n=1 Tax=Nelusetta ayraudi TaxID=303726 RepID=UPI003F702D12